MKKILSLTLLAGMIAFSACGPSAEEKAATEKAAQDSMAAPVDSTQMSADTTQK